MRIPFVDGGPDWLTARPVAHRGLHDRAHGIIENTASAFDAARQAGFGIECDVQLSADGEAMVFHDFFLDRLTEAKGPVDRLTADALMRVPLKGTRDRILRLGELFDLVAGEVPLLIEIKSDFSGDTRLVRRVAELTLAYRGPAALMSFDPAVLVVLKESAPEIPRGIVAEYALDGEEWHALTDAQRRRLRFLLHWPQTRFQFVNYAVRDLDQLPARIAHAVGLPLLAWTVRTRNERSKAIWRGAQLVFEGFIP